MGLLDQASIWWDSRSVYKAQLVALRNMQKYGVDYEETFALVAKMTMVRTVISIAASQS